MASITSELWTFIVSNQQVVASLAALFSSLVAFFVALLTLVQVRTNRRMLLQSEIASTLNWNQLQVAQAALTSSIRESDRTRMDARSPVVAVVPLPQYDFVLTEEFMDPVEGSLVEQFEAVRESTPLPDELEVDLHVFAKGEIMKFWLTGKVLLRNDGQSSAVIWLHTELWEIVEGEGIERLGPIQFLLPGQTSCTVQWFYTYSVALWFNKAQAAFEDKSEYPLNPEYNFKYLGVDIDQWLLDVESAAIPGLSDSYFVRFVWLPLRDEQFARRRGRRYYVLDHEPPEVELSHRRRAYPGHESGEEAEMQGED